MRSELLDWYLRLRKGTEDAGKKFLSRTRNAGRKVCRFTLFDVFLFLLDLSAKLLLHFSDPTVVVRLEVLDLLADVDVKLRLYRADVLLVPLVDDS